MSYIVKWMMDAKDSFFSARCSLRSRWFMQNKPNSPASGWKSDNSDDFNGCLLPGVVPEILNMRND